ncbi:MAG TPA: PKD domain-containing protein, partial [Bacteroidetes bacterium]|nr:PKD domain-containing protein [Bacteroidota bacterium]
MKRILFSFLTLLFLAGCSGDGNDQTKLLDFEVQQSDKKVTLIAKADPSMQASNYTWEMGDGKTVTGQKVEYTYAEGGYYDVTLIVGNSCGDEKKM